MRLTKLQKRLCNLLQDGLPICARPYADLAKFLNTDEKTVLQQTIELKKAGIIRRISPLINYHVLGLTGTLVTAHTPEENLQEVAETVNALDNVSHNYLRKHYYNLWFTLQAQSPEQIKAAVAGLSDRFGIDFYSLPVKRVFKLNVRFDIENGGQLSDDIKQLPQTQKVKLDEKEKQILSKLQDELEISKKPFDFLCSDSLETEEVLRIIQGLIDKGVIRRIAATVDHRKLGFIANVLFCCEVPKKQIIEAGKRLARFGIVSHCYQRETVKDWPYNLFAMMHGRSISEIQHVINKFIEAEKINSFELLPTAKELKKQPIKYRFY